jgi:hypothetical protein
VRERDAAGGRWARAELARARARRRACGACEARHARGPARPPHPRAREQAQDRLRRRLGRDHPQAHGVHRARRGRAAGGAAARRPHRRVAGRLRRLARPRGRGRIRRRRRLGKALGACALGGSRGEGCCGRHGRVWGGGAAHGRAAPCRPASLSGAMLSRRPRPQQARSTPVARAHRSPPPRRPRSRGRRRRVGRGRRVAQRGGARRSRARRAGTARRRRPRRPRGAPPRAASALPRTPAANPRGTRPTLPPGMFAGLRSPGGAARSVPGGRGGIWRPFQRAGRARGRVRVALGRRGTPRCRGSDLWGRAVLLASKKGGAAFLSRVKTRPQRGSPPP